MKSLTILSYLAILWMTSCNQFVQDKKEIGLSFIENFLQKGATSEEIKKLLGEPNRVIKFKRISEIVYIYDNKINNLPEWKFGVNKVGQIVWINHKPWSNPLVDRVEILPVTWKKYNCKKKTRPDKSVPHVIKDYTFFECAEGKIRAYYNIHGEISTIVVAGGH